MIHTLHFWEYYIIFGRKVKKIPPRRRKDTKNYGHEKAQETQEI